MQVALQSGTTDTPGAFTHIDVQGDFNPNTDQGKVPVEVERDDGEITKPAMGAKSGGFPLTGLVRGKGAGAGNSTAAVGGEFDALLDALCGAAGAHGTGLTSGADHDTDTIKLADTGGHPIGNGLLIDSDPTSGVRYESWYLDADDSAHSHVYCKAEGEDWRRDLLGCGVKASLVCPAGGLAQWQWEILANDWEDEAEENPTYSAPTSVGALSVLGSPFYIGATKTELIECTIDFGMDPQPRTATDGANGQNGWIYNYGGAKANFKIYWNDTTMGTFQGDNVVDIAFQLGDTSASATPGNCLYTRIPALSVTEAKMVKHNGIDAIAFSGIATRPSSGTGSVRIHLFASAA